VKKSNKIMLASMSLAAMGSMTTLGAFASTNAYASSSHKDAAGTVNVAAITSLSGSISDLGVPGYDAEQLAIKQINAKGGLLGKKINLIEFDDASQPNLGNQYAQTAILQDHVSAIFGPVSSAVAAAIEPVAAAHKTLVFFHTSNDISLTTTGFTKYAFQVTPNTNMESTAVAMLFKKKGWTRIATISPDYSYGRDTINNFLKTLKKIGVHYTLLNQQWPQLGTTDYSSYISTLLSVKPQAVFSPVFGGDLVSFAKQAMQFGLLKKTNFVSMMGPTVLQVLGNQAPVGAWGYSRAPFYAIHTSDMNKFVNTYKAAYHQYPTAFAVMAYTAVQTWAYGVQHAHSFNSDAVVKVLGGATVPTIRGNITINKNNHQAQVGEWVGQVSYNKKYPFAIWKNIIYFTPKEILK
jgi:branched-chain amino acid transport system substrate-binding protein